MTMNMTQPRLATIVVPGFNSKQSRTYSFSMQDVACSYISLSGMCRRRPQPLGMHHTLVPQQWGWQAVG